MTESMRPPAIPSMDGAPATPSRVFTYACAGCGARVEFAPGTNALRCPYCQHETPVIPATRTVVEHPFAELRDRPRTVLAVHAWHCEKCGATTDTDDLATICQFCGAPLVDAGAEMEQIAPEAVLPFEIDRTGVRTALRSWVRSRRFAPRSFRTVSEAESLSGTYVPHWTFDADTTSDYTGQRGEHYWATETYTTTVNGQTQTQTRPVQRTAWYPAAGRVFRAFDDLIVRASRRLDPKHQDKLEPWPLTNAAAYQPDYLAGYSALRYDVEPEDGLETAKRQMAPVIERDCRTDIGGDEQRVQSVSTSYANVMFKLMLLPVWVVSYLYAGQSWQVLVNGRTGEVIGRRPYSKWKIAAAIIAALVVIAAIVVVVVASRRN